MNTLILERKDSYAVITLNRPNQYNAVNLEMGKELMELITQLSHDRDTRAIMLTGAGKGFCAGGDVKEMGAFIDENPPVLFKKLTHNVHGIVSSILRIEVPVICAVNGPAAGVGFSLVLACDMAYASDDAGFTVAYPAIALVPDGGCTYFLSRTVGYKRAIEILYSNRRLSANEAMELGLVNRVVPKDSLMEEALRLTERLASGPTRAFGRAKRLMLKGMENPLETQLENERQLIASSADTEDFKEGVRAFMEKRSVDFHGK